MECYNEDVKKKEEKEYNAFYIYIPGYAWPNFYLAKSPNIKYNTSFMDLVVIV